MTVALVLGVAALGLAFVLVPLLRATSNPPDRRDLDLAFYRRQLSEIEDEVGRGLIAKDQADAARLEVERRLLKAAAGEKQVATRQRSAIPALLVSGAFITLGCALYLAHGQPGFVSAQVEEPRTSDIVQPELPEGAGPGMDELLGQLAARLAENPDDPRGWSIYGRALSNLGRHPEAVNVYAEALRHLPENGDLWAAQGQALIVVGEGRIVPAARHAFRQAQLFAPNHPGARHYLALAKYQDRDFRGAYDDWAGLMQSAPANAPWREPVAAGLRLAAEALGEPMPTIEDVEQAAQMTEAERNAFIESMVERLAERLEGEPDNREGWLRLGQAYKVLGKAEKATQAYTIARDLSEGDEKARIQLEIDALQGN